MDWLTDEYYLSKLHFSQLKELLQFYLSDIYEHFGFTDYTTEAYENELLSLLNEDKSFYDLSIYYVIRKRNTREIFGAIRITYWDRKTILPIEKLFNINLKEALPKRSNLWHIGRFVITKHLPINRISFFKKLLYNAFYPVHRFGEGLVIAECDKKVITTLQKLGIKSNILGESIEYICSETFPIYIESGALNPFILANSQRYFSNNNISDVNWFSKIITCHNQKMVSSNYI